VSNSLIPALASIAAIAITVVGQWINTRNDRVITNQELDLLKKLDPGSDAAKQLSQVIATRISDWHAKSQPSRLDRRRAVVWMTVGYLIWWGALLLSRGGLEFLARQQLHVWVLTAASFVVFISGLYSYMKYVNQRNTERANAAKTTPRNG
jgi:hypothetical protein